MISVSNLQVRYGTRQVLETVSFAVRAGEVMGLLGPNGAGKTTTLSVLATLLRPATGEVTIAGCDLRRRPNAVRRVLGYVPQSLALYPTLTAAENVRFFARLLGLRGAPGRAAVAEVLALVGLADRRDDIVATFSGGMQRRLNLACGLLHQPRVLLLDEPTVGVDPQSRERIFAAVRHHAGRGAAVLYSTHYLEEAERLCDRVVLIDHGRVIAAGTPAELIDRITPGLRLEIVTRAALPPGWIGDLPGAALLAPALPADAHPGGAAAHVRLARAADATALLERAARLGGEVLEFHLHQPTLQDVFLHLTGRALRD